MVDLKKNNVLLTAYLNEYIKMSKPQFAVMITGRWGSGKTYYINNRIKEWEKAKVKAEGNSIKLKPIYISVYGLQSISEVVGKIRTKVYPLLYSKGAKVAQNVVKTAFQILAKSKVDFDGDGTGEDLNSFLDAEGVLEIFKSDSTSIKGNRILVFDDLERCHVPLDEFFGFVNSLVEHSDSKVILICEEEKLKEVADKDKLKVEYKDFKEKLVGQTFSLDVNYAEITETFIAASENKLLIDNCNLIVDLFVASKCENLRIIKRCLLDIERFFKQLPGEIETNANYSFFVRNVIAYLVITSIEDRFGNKDIEDFQSFGLLGNKEATLMLEGKYNHVLERYKLNHSSYSVPISTMLNFVRTGYLEDPMRIVASCRLLQSRNINNWEKLWRCNTLTNEEFVELLKKEKDRFYNKKLEYAFEVEHLAGIMLSLERRGLVKASRGNVVRLAKKNITEIFKAYPNDLSRIVTNGQGYEFQESTTEEMREIIGYASSLMQKRMALVEKDYVTEAWNELKAGMSHLDIENLFDRPTSTHRCYYSQEGIFWQVAPKILAEKIVCLPNVTKMEFSYFLMGRYYLEGSGIRGMMREEMKIDKEPLMKISAILKSKAKRLKLLDKEETLFVAGKIDEAVSKM